MRNRRLLSADRSAWETGKPPSYKSPELCVRRTPRPAITRVDIQIEPEGQPYDCALRDTLARCGGALRGAAENPCCQLVAARNQANADFGAPLADWTFLRQRRTPWPFPLAGDFFPCSRRRTRAQHVRPIQTTAKPGSLGGFYFAPRLNRSRSAAAPVAPAGRWPATPRPWAALATAESGCRSRHGTRPRSCCGQSTRSR